MTSNSPSECVIYVRISDDPSEQALGVERQETVCQEWAASHGFTVTRVYRDNDISASNGKLRPDFEQLLKDRPRDIVCWHNDRLLRKSTKDLERVLDLGCKVHALQAGEFDLSTPTGRALARTVTAWAQNEVELKGERQRLANRQRAAMGRKWWSKKPYGYALDGTVDVTQAPYIAEAYRMLVTGSTMGDITRYWESVGFTRGTGKSHTPRDVGRILKYARNAGINTYHDVEVGPGDWEAIVDEPTYRAALAILNDPTRLTPRAVSSGASPTTELGGLSFVSCGVCGAHIKKRGTIAKRKAFATFYCCSATQHLNYPEDWLNAVVFKRLITELASRPDLWSGELDDGDTERLRILKSGKIAAESRSSEVGQAFASGTISLAALQAAEDSLKGQLAQINAELARLGQGQSWTALEAVRDEEYLAQELAQMSRGEYRTLLSRVFTKITLTPLGRGARTYDPDKVVFEPSAA